MKVILLERVGRSGHIGDEVNVKDGFARNYLLPQGKALRATEANRKRFENERAHIEQRNEERRQAAAGIAGGLDGRTVTLIRQAGETGQLYGSVAARDIIEALAKDGFVLQRNQVGLADAIKSVGVHSVPLHLHSDVAVSITVNVARSEDEAARQAAGEDVSVHTFEADEGGDFAAGQKDAAADDRFED
jgi:large subunit ribosomal protein L9